MTSNRRQSERGYALLFVFAMSAMMAMMLYLEMPRLALELAIPRLRQCVAAGGMCMCAADCVGFGLPCSRAARAASGAALRRLRSTAPPPRTSPLAGSRCLARCLSRTLWKAR